MLTRKPLFFSSLFSCKKIANSLSVKEKEKKAKIIASPKRDKKFVFFFHFFPRKCKKSIFDSMNVFIT